MRFQVGTPFESDQPHVVVDAGLAPGTHRFELIVVNRRGQRSVPITVDVIVEPAVIRIPQEPPVVIRPPVRPPIPEI